jgi:iron complex transport system substrate-binding protein
MARRLGIRSVEIAEPHSFADVRANIHSVAAALGRRAAGAALVAEMDAALAVPVRPRPAVMVSGAGLTIAPDGLAAQWLAHAGLQQQPVPRGQLALERLLANPPQILVLTRYRSQQVSTSQRWLQHPALAALPASTRRISTDGRAWTCLGPALASEIARLRRVVGP